jgi:hypothetical protein
MHPRSSQNQADRHVLSHIVRSKTPLQVDFSPLERPHFAFWNCAVLLSVSEISGILAAKFALRAPFFAA